MGQMNSPLSGSIFATSLWQASIRTGRPEALNSDAPAGSNATVRVKRSLRASEGKLAEASLAEPPPARLPCLCCWRLGVLTLCDVFRVAAVVNLHSVEAHVSEPFDVVLVVQAAVRAFALLPAPKWR